MARANQSVVGKAIHWSAEASFGKFRGDTKGSGENWFSQIPTAKNEWYVSL
jgi:hypothetical protein